VPGQGVPITASSFSPASGQADPRLTTCAFASAARRQGAADCVMRAQTVRGLVQAEQIVLGSDAWSRELASSVGLQMPLRMRVLQALLSTPATPCFLASVLSAVGRALSLKRQASGALMLGGCWLGDSTPGAAPTPCGRRVSGETGRAPAICSHRFASCGV